MSATSPVMYTTTPKTLTGGWDLAISASSGLAAAIIADSVGVGMLWSSNAAPATGEGVPFSSSSSPGSWDFSAAPPRGPIYVKGPVGSVLTVATA